MPSDGAIIFGDLIGKLDIVRVECPKCGRSGRYRLANLLMRCGRNEKLLLLGMRLSTRQCVGRLRRASNTRRSV